MSRSAEPLPVFSAAEMRAFEAAALGAQGSADERVVLESAGRAVASAVESMYPDGRIAVVFGSGNNGGDAVVAARTLAARGRDVVLISGSGADVPEGLLHGWRLPQAGVDALELFTISAHADAEDEAPVEHDLLQFCQYRQWRGNNERWVELQRRDQLPDDHDDDQRNHRCEASKRQARHMPQSRAAWLD